MEESLAIAERSTMVEGMIRGYKNLGSTLWELGELDRAVDLERRGAEVARRFGIDFQVAWFETELGALAYLDGDWDAAMDACASLDRWVARVGPHYMEGGMLGTRGADPCRPRRSGRPVLHRSRARLRPSLARRRCCSQLSPTRP